MASAALGLYAFTGIDTVESFFGCGKVPAMKRMLKSSDMIYSETMQSLGREDKLSDELFKQLELSTIEDCLQ